MKMPNLAPVTAVPAGEVSENGKNGLGYWSFLPNDPASLQEGLQTVREYGDYLELPAIVDTLASEGSVLVQGDPGSGKSHLIRDMQVGCVVADIPTFCLTMHINGGKRDGIAAITEPFEAFREASLESGGVVILDNVDYVGYKGTHRRRSASTEYAEKAEGFVEKILKDPGLVVLGTIHDEGWRQSQWVWDDPAIDDPARRILEGFSSRIGFEGKMSLVGLAHLIRGESERRGSPVSLGVASLAIRTLHKFDRANFFHANHLNAPDFLRNPQSEIDRLEAGRRERRGANNTSVDS